jgi:hypothetical protein
VGQAIRARLVVLVVDASIIALAERHAVDTIATLDHRHLGAVVPRHADAFVLVP